MRCLREGIWCGISECCAALRRASPAIALRKGKSNFLFDCGEDTQRQLLRQALVRPGKIDRVFITRAAAETSFGLPGLLSEASATLKLEYHICDTRE